MFIRQISVFLENQSGRLSDVTETLAARQIDIRALSIADTTDFGILRLIVNKPEEALASLRESGFTVNLTSVIAVRLEDSPGALNTVLKKMKNAQISVEYAYAFITRKQDDAYLILRIENPETMADKLRDFGLELLPAAKLYEL